MSSEGAGAMSEENSEKSALVPRLRFPGFLEAWASSPMSGLYSFKGNNSLSRDKLNYEAGELRNIHYGDIHTKFALHFRVDAERVPYVNPGESSSAIRPDNFCMAGDIVFADASEDMADIGKAIEIIDAGDVPLVSGLHTILARPNEGSFALGFGAYLFSSEGVRKQIQRESQGAKVLGLSATRLGNVQLHYPSKPDEQQKIADCLSSLDELITAETQKLDALKTHKKGMMQQLFPREGETAPRLRFPEFREAGEWEPKTIGNSCESFSGGTPSTTNKSFYGGQIPFIRSAEIDKDETELFLSNEGLKNSAAKMVKVGDILVALYGANSGDVALSKIDGAINQAILCLRHETNNRFVYQYLAHKKEWIIATFIQGGQGNLSGEIIKAIGLFFPRPNEQQRIADCLSSLDDLITAQSQKIDVLKTHKKGQMQQLFPVLDEAQA